MSQHDMDLANQAGASYRSDNNNALGALVTLSSGATAPASTFAHMLWVDTTSGTLKRRNAANTGWIVVRTVDESFVLSRSSNTILDVSDIGKAVIATSTFTQTLDAAATLGDGWFVHYRNDGTDIITLDPNAAELIDGAATLRLLPGESCIVVCNGSAFKTIGLGNINTVVPVNLCEGRLTLTTGVPVTTADVTAAETIYFTPYRGNKIALYDGTEWRQYTFTELSGDVPDATQMNDVFVYDNAGTLTLDIVAWTNDTTRATALVLQDGVYVKSGATSRRYVGSFYSTIAGNGQTEDSAANRFIWNYYNRVSRTLKAALETTNSWTYTLAAFRQANANAANQLNFIVGVSEDLVEAYAIGSNINSTGGGTRTVGIGLDSTTANAAGVLAAQNSTSGIDRQVTASWGGYPGIGKHFLAWLEYSTASGTTTWFGDNGIPAITQSGISGVLYG